MRIYALGRDLVEFLATVKQGRDHDPPRVYISWQGAPEFTRESRPGAAEGWHIATVEGPVFWQ